MGLENASPGELRISLATVRVLTACERVNYRSRLAGGPRPNAAGILAGADTDTSPASVRELRRVAREKLVSDWCGEIVALGFSAGLRWLGLSLLLRLAAACRLSADCGKAVWTT